MFPGLYPELIRINGAIRMLSGLYPDYIRMSTYPDYIRIISGLYPDEVPIPDCIEIHAFIPCEFQSIIWI